MTDKELQNLIGIRYAIDYRHVPGALFRAPTAVLNALLTDVADDLFAALYNDAYEGIQTYAPSDFVVTRYMDEDDFIFFVNLPAGYEGGMTRCLAYGFAFVRENDDMAAQFFMVEEKKDGSKVLGGLDVHLDHRDFGAAMATDEENARRMLAIAKKDDALNFDSQVDF